ncbi:MAG: SDR family oxidoreductase [Candidatus Lokiarchaeota archaeon]|nr:SDR family oxidoreductase [Candidatus Lokiarchaeota archaeon]
MHLKGKAAIVTGAGAGIGEATAKLFAQEGAKVVCCSLSDSAKKVVKEINEGGGTAFFIQGDVAKEKVCKTIIEDTISHYKNLYILFNNAGMVIPGVVHENTAEEWDRIMAVNVRSIFLLSKYAYPYLKQTQGTIINNSSVLALKGVKNRAAYSASKGAVSALTRAMAMDYMEDNIRVNAICPGTTDTPSLSQRLAKYTDPQEARNLFIARQPMKRLGRPEEIAQAVLFLATNEFTTGINLSIDGGMTI